MGAPQNSDAIPCGVRAASAMAKEVKRVLALWDKGIINGYELMSMTEEAVKKLKASPLFSGKKKK